MRSRNKVSNPLLALALNPPARSKLAAAKRFGIDLTLTVQRMGMSPDERVREMENALRFLQELRKR